MKILFKSLATFLFVSSPYVFAEKNSMPAVLCVDAESYWDGPYTVEISPENEMGEIFASVYNQAEEGRFIVGNEVKVQKNFQGTQLVYSGENFNLVLQMESFAVTNKHSAQLTFRRENTFIYGSYLCLLF